MRVASLTPTAVVGVGDMQRRLSTTPSVTDVSGSSGMATTQPELNGTKHTFSSRCSHNF